MAFTEDLAAFFDTSGFAVVATWASTTVNVIFDAAYAEPLGNVVEGSAPVALGRAADFPGVAHGQAITINAVAYTIRGVEPDGTGLVLLRLEKA